jgi:SAM-dependent methyltransferase
MEIKNKHQDMISEVKECYDVLADYYDLIFDDWNLSIARQAAALAPILVRECGPIESVRLLDCACGIGTQTLGLLSLGFSVVGCDLSPRAIARATKEAVARGFHPSFSVADMLDLNSVIESDFNAVICMDNALPHLESKAQLIQAATQMRAKLRRGGSLMASIRDYDQLIDSKPAVHGPAFYADGENRRIVFQVWDWIEERRYQFHLYITRQTSNVWQTIHATSLYRAVLRNELHEVLELSGFDNIRWISPAESAFYQPIVLARAV